ncbi:hypothetical protein HIM_07094 [Hirsutella minnesotensis 3608]|uniref:Mitochondrial ATPase complex subunit ATP10 n=1 Tax=Hirsutella minnesotensis 3608 TaxID=1043627 RepID=A0A0F7ZTQ8_9HYPO|nr:hypothetical protein HIM_07094 [Hirsutella minnesotensis 3608]
MAAESALNPAARLCWKENPTSANGTSLAGTVLACQVETRKKSSYKYFPPSPKHDTHILDLPMPPRGLDSALVRLAARQWPSWPPQQSVCLRCQWRRGIAQSAPRSARSAKPAAGASMDPKSTISGPAIEAPRSYGKRVDEFTPKPLPRPIGMPLPPREGENMGIDLRTLKQRRDDLVDYDKHLQRRKELTAQISRPYFRDWGNLKFHEGKSFIAPPRLFKAELSLFFPNLYGNAILTSEKTMRDTTPALTGKVSVVSIFSSQWAERQADSFISKAANPELHDVLDQSKGAAQLVRINYEDNAGKAWLIRLFRRSLRKRLPERDWQTYFLVRRGITDNIRESIGLLNARVGYTYLVDQHCRIRWAGSGPSHPDELESLNRGVARLVDEANRRVFVPGAVRPKGQEMPAAESGV